MPEDFATRISPPDLKLPVAFIHRRGRSSSILTATNIEAVNHNRTGAS